MGTTNSHEKKVCLLCLEDISAVDLLVCSGCDIKLHSYCEEICRVGKEPCKCPHCKRIGSLYAYKYAQ